MFPSCDVPELSHRLGHLHMFSLSWCDGAGPATTLPGFRGCSMSGLRGFFGRSHFHINLPRPISSVRREACGPTRSETAMPMAEEADTLNFDTIAREWCCKWSAEAGKISLRRIQDI